MYAIAMAITSRKTKRQFEARSAHYWIREFGTFRQQIRDALAPVWLGNPASDDEEIILAVRKVVFLFCHANTVSHVLGPRELLAHWIAEDQTARGREMR